MFSRILNNGQCGSIMKREKDEEDVKLGGGKNKLEEGGRNIVP